MAPDYGGHSSLVVPVTMTLNDYRSVAVMVVPTAMQSAVMSVELGTRAAIVVPIAIIGVSVASDADTETLGARNRRSRNCDGRQGGENASNLFHVNLLLMHRENGAIRHVPGTTTKLF